MMRRRRLAFAPMMAAAITALSLGSGGIIAQAAPLTTYVIGVDAATPANHLLMYTDFFPRAGTTVRRRDVVDFKWDAGSPDGFHTATLIKTGDNPNAVYAANPPVTPDSDDGAGTIQENPAIGAPSNPACGTVASPCPFDGTAQLNSGAAPTAPGKDFYVSIDAAAGTTVTFLCLIHPGMVGSLLVAANASTPASVSAAAAAQYASDTTEALAAEAAVTVPAPTTNSDGSMTWNAVAGTEGQHEQVLEYFPKSLSITTGDSVKWTSNAHDIHTVTFPDGAASAADDFHQFVCEAGPPDTAAAAPPAPPCANPANFESHFTGGPAGGTTLADPSTLATSGVIAAPPLPFPSNYTFKVVGAGTYTYQCKVHDHMTGEVLAAAVVAPQLPKAGAGLRTQEPARGSGILAVIAILGLIALGSLARIASRQER